MMIGQKRILKQAKGFEKHVHSSKPKRSRTELKDKNRKSNGRTINGSKSVATLTLSDVTTFDTYLFLFHSSHLQFDHSIISRLLSVSIFVSWYKNSGTVLALAVLLFVTADAITTPPVEGGIICIEPVAIIPDDCTGMTANDAIDDVTANGCCCNS